MDLYLKVGDQSEGGKTDGEIICWSDPNNYKPEYSNNMKMVFCILRFALDEKNKIIDKIEGIDDKKYISFDDLETESGIPNLVEKLRSSDLVDPIVIDFHKLKFKKDKNPPVFDVNAIAGGTYTIGTAGDYVTYALFYADWAAFTSPMIGNQISAISETGATAISENFGVHSLTLNGNGFETSLAAGVFCHYFTSFAGSGTVIIKNMNMCAVGAPTRSIIFGAGATFSGTISIYKNMLDGASEVNSQGLTIDDATPIILEYDNNYVDCAVALSSSATNALSKFENSSFYNNTIDVVNNDLAITYKNYAFFNSGTIIFQTVNSISVNCGTDAGAIGAATDTDPQVGLTDANEFESFIKTDTNFLKVKDSGSCFDNGAAPSIAGNTTGIYGNPRPDADGNISIGASQWLVATGGFAAKYFNQSLIEEPTTLW